ncbi:PIG-L family deacetylase [Actinomycetospora endophytica]|uniref:PIG-L family deacetylase n=1 Tax=Actinomycetospora endophytica TaxID=2291215 RepID=A0ABS8PLI9_9PSEU|nr:PIG-L deacetylase family protein [Actinomycetospora endophytica]MCD2197844.1 PIG-L family deacetylase [Actinomycetospora endophytica]
MARILMIVAHPDDIDFGSGGTVARWVAEGNSVDYCICTDGDAGGYDEAVGRIEMAELRRKEQRAAADVYGVGEIDWLGHPDGRLYVTHELRRDISRSIRRHRPDRVVVPSPTRNIRSTYGSHPDHIAAGEAAMCAVYPDARNPFAHPELLAEEGLEAWTVGETWIANPGEGADLYIDITDYMDAKVAALRAHESQTGHMDELGDRMRMWGYAQAKAAGWCEDGTPEDQRRYAEGFLVLDTK